MKCHDIQGHLSAYVAEEAAPDLRRSVKAHLKGCKKCRARIAPLKVERAVQKKQTETSVPPQNGAPLPQKPPSTPVPIGGIISSVWGRPVEMTVTIVLIAGIFFLYRRGTSDPKADVAIVESTTTPAAEALTLSASAENHGGEQGKEVQIPPLPPQTAPAGPPASPPMKVHNVTTQRSSQPPAVKLLLISRNIQEAADTVAAGVVESQGKVLSKKGDEMETKMLLLLPAERYETFSNSLRSVGLVKDLSKREPPFMGSLKIEVTIE